MNILHLRRAWPSSLEGMVYERIRHLGCRRIHVGAWTRGTRWRRRLTCRTATLGGMLEGDAMDQDPLGVRSLSQGALLSPPPEKNHVKPTHNPVPHFCREGLTEAELYLVRQLIVSTAPKRRSPSPEVILMDDLGVPEEAIAYHNEGSSDDGPHDYYIAPGSAGRDVTTVRCVPDPVLFGGETASPLGQDPNQVQASHRQTGSDDDAVGGEVEGASGFAEGAYRGGNVLTCGIQSFREAKLPPGESMESRERPMSAISEDILVLEPLPTELVSAARPRPKLVAGLGRLAGAPPPLAASAGWQREEGRSALGNQRAIPLRHTRWQSEKRCSLRAVCAQDGPESVREGSLPAPRLPNSAPQPAVATEVPSGASSFQPDIQALRPSSGPKKPLRPAGKPAAFVAAEAARRRVTRQLEAAMEAGSRRAKNAAVSSERSQRMLALQNTGAVCPVSSTGVPISCQALLAQDSEGGGIGLGRRRPRLVGR